MPRRPRQATGDVVYHVLNRSVRRMTLFEQDGDYIAFENILEETLQRIDCRLLAYCVMPNHWHLLLWPRRDGDLSEFMRLLTVTHTQRWHAHRQSAGTGPVYQGRFKSFPVESDEHLLTVGRYIERNALRARLVQAAEDWPFGSLWIRVHGNARYRAMLHDWPVDRPRGWRQWVNAAQTEAELATLRRCVQRGRPYGSDTWIKRTATRLGLASTLRPRGRPRKVT